jgi:hypothetical protein
MPISREIHDAVDVLARLRRGDEVTVTEDGRDYAMTVTREIHRSDGAYGSYESSRVTVSLGVGRWSTEIHAERMAAGRQAIRPRVAV